MLEDDWNIKGSGWEITKDGLKGYLYSQIDDATSQLKAKWVMDHAGPEQVNFKTSPQSYTDRALRRSIREAMRWSRYDTVTWDFDNQTLALKITVSAHKYGLDSFHLRIAEASLSACSRAPFNDLFRHHEREVGEVLEAFAIVGMFELIGEVFFGWSACRRFEVNDFMKLTENQSGKVRFYNDGTYIFDMGAQKSEQKYLSNKADELPGIFTVVPHPILGTDATIRNIIIGLNDIAQWTRDQIADWLDSLTDSGLVDINDLAFEVPEKEMDNEG